MVFRLTNQPHFPTIKQATMYHYGLRVLQPDTGRWLSPDPIGTRGGLNLYGFVGNGPSRRIDVLGRMSYEECHAAASAAHAAAQPPSGYDYCSLNDAYVVYNLEDDAKDVPSDYHCGIRLESGGRDTRIIVTVRYREAYERVSTFSSCSWSITYRCGRDCNDFPVDVEVASDYNYEQISITPMPPIEEYQTTYWQATEPALAGKGHDDLCAQAIALLENSP